MILTGEGDTPVGHAAVHRTGAWQGRKRGRVSRSSGPARNRGGERPDSCPGPCRCPPYNSPRDQPSGMVAVPSRVPLRHRDDRQPVPTEAVLPGTTRAPPEARRAKGAVAHSVMYRVHRARLPNRGIPVDPPMAWVSPGTKSGVIFTPERLSTHRIAWRIDGDPARARPPRGRVRRLRGRSAYGHGRPSAPTRRNPGGVRR